MIALVIWFVSLLCLPAIPRPGVQILGMEERFGICLASLAAVCVARVVVSRVRRARSRCPWLGRALLALFVTVVSFAVVFALVEGVWLAVVLLIHGGPGVAEAIKIGCRVGIDESYNVYHDRTVGVLTLVAFLTALSSLPPLILAGRRRD